LDPDVIVVGELSDGETITTALAAIEAGRLVLARVPGRTAVDAIERLLFEFDAERRARVRLELARSLKGVLAQRLLPGTGPGKRVMVHDFLIMTDAAQSLLVEDKLQLLHNVIETGLGRGMQSMDRMIRSALKRGLITYEVARDHVGDKRKIEGIGRPK
jgi:twitching motility protein PilT